MRARYWLLIPCMIFHVIGQSANAVAGDNLIRLQGAGATFPAPLYVRWFRNFYNDYPDIQVDYQAIGSGAGIANLLEKRIDFAGSDVPLEQGEMAKFDPQVVQLPVTAGAIVLIFNLGELKALSLSREAFTGIFLGQVERWNDPRIAATNPGVELPDLPITVVARAGSSGTTYVLTKHLSAVSTQFTKSVGVSKAPVWPRELAADGSLIKTRGNGGVAALVRTLLGTIGYVEYSYARFSPIPMATLENRAGQFITPSTESFRVALDSVQLPDDMVIEMPDPQGEDAYPLVTYTWLMFHKQFDKPKKLEAFKKVLEYCLSEKGQQVSAKLGYVPLPDKVVMQVKSVLARVQANTP